MKQFIIISGVLLFFTGIANAFSNSLDGTNQTQSFPQNNFANQTTIRNNINQPLIPKAPSSFNHSNNIYTSPQMNDTRYNSNCQFGQCLPGGHTPTSR